MKRQRDDTNKFEVETSIDQLYESKKSRRGSSKGDISDKSNISGESYSFLLATSTDRSVLNELHCLVRENIEVFTANKSDVDEPQPGRKVPVEFGQIGIRCIHCKKLPAMQRAKRAVCYPNAIVGILHSVSNMKFDHFPKCPKVPDTIKKELVQLKAISSRKAIVTGRGYTSTAHYYQESAKKLGMFDSNDGIKLKRQEAQGLLTLASASTIVASRSDDSLEKRSPRLNASSTRYNIPASYKSPNYIPITSNSLRQPPPLQFSNRQGICDHKQNACLLNHIDYSQSSTSRPAVLESKGANQAATNESAQMSHNDWSLRDKSTPPTEPTLTDCRMSI